MTTEASSHEEPTSPLAAARLLAAAGYHVIPIKEGGKHPPIADWWNNATTGLDMIDNWWQGLYAKCGVGIATGYNGIFALDVDVGPGKAGDETLRDLELAYGDLPETIEQRTGSGGRHLFFRAPPGVEIRNDAGRRLGPGLDIRGIGGQVVAAPTIHPNGQPYIWLIASAPWEREPADAPGWLVDLLTKEDQWSSSGTGSEQARAPSSSAPMTSVMGSPSAATATSGGAASSWLSQPSSSVPTVGDRPGDRFNATTTWETLLAADGWTRLRNGPQGEQRWTRPGKHAKDGCSATVGWAGTDLLKVFTSSVPTLAQDRTYDRWGYHVATRWHGDFAAAARALVYENRQTATYDPADLIGSFANLDDESADDANAPRSTPNPPDLFRWRIAWPDFWTREHADENWHLAPVLARGRGHALWAGAKTGKSYHVLPMALAIATGRAHLDKPPGTPEHVIYMDYEMTEDDLHDRLTEFGYGPDTDLDHLHYIHLPSIPGLDTADGAAYVIQAVRHIGATAVIIDTISRAVEGPENDADTLRSFYRHTGLALKELGVTWARLDHGGKDPTKGTRGTSAKNDDVDIVWKLTRTDAGMRFEATHRRIAWVPEKVDVKVTEDADGAMRFRTLAAPAEPPGTSELVALLNRLGVAPDAGKPTARRALKEANETAPNNVLEAALRRRKAARNRHGQLLDDLIETGSTGSTGSYEKEQVTDLGQVDGQPRAGDLSVSAGSCPPLRGATPHAAPFNPFFDI